MKISETVLELQSGHDFVTDRRPGQKQNVSQPHTGRHNERLNYYEITFHCIRGGKNFKCRNMGLRVHTEEIYPSIHSFSEFSNLKYSWFLSRVDKYSTVLHAQPSLSNEYLFP